MRKNPVRKAHSKGIIRQIFAHSGNLCAFPKCGELMIDKRGKFVGQICHIEGVMPKSERFNPKMTDEERADVSNLMLMCYAHHIETNDVSKYTVEKLRKMKANHERRFADPARSILEAISDSTVSDVMYVPRNIKQIANVLEWGLDDSQMEDEYASLNEYLKKLEKAPLPVRMFLANVAKRMVKVKNTHAVYNDGFSSCIDISDLSNSLIGPKGQRMSAYKIQKLAEDLSIYGLGGVDEHREGAHKAVVKLYHAGGWPLWLDLVRFCEIESIPFEAFYQDLDFTSLAE